MDTNIIINSFINHKGISGEMIANLSEDLCYQGEGFIIINFWSLIYSFTGYGHYKITQEIEIEKEGYPSYKFEINKTVTDLTGIEKLRSDDYYEVEEGWIYLFNQVFDVDEINDAIFDFWAMEEDIDNEN